MEFLDIIKNRRSVRSFIDKPLEKSILYTIIDAARFAPSAGNLQNWEFIVIEGQEKKNKIARMCLNQIWMATAPYIIIVCAKTEKCRKYYGEYGDKYALENGVFAASHIVLAAQEFNVNGIFVGAFDEYGLKELLVIPHDVIVVGVIPLGYSVEKPNMPLRYELKSLINFNKWGNKVTDFKYEVLGETSHHVERIAKNAKSSAIENSKSLFEYVKSKFIKKDKTTQN